MPLPTLVPALLLGLLASLGSLDPTNSLARASALTTTISAHERSCFYAWVDKEGEKVGFYFAVRPFAGCSSRALADGGPKWTRRLGAIGWIFRCRLGHH